MDLTGVSVCLDRDLIGSPLFFLFLRVLNNANGMRYLPHSPDPRHSTIQAVCFLTKANKQLEPSA